MKNSIHLIALAFIILTAATSCNKHDDPPPAPIVKPLADNSLPSGAVSNVLLTSKSTSTLEFTIDITVFRDSKNIENQLKAENFNIDTLVQSASRYYFNRINVNTSGSGAASPYSALMLMDQSGSILTTDPKDYRIEAAKAFCTNLGTGDNVLLWSFADNSQQKYGTAFTTDGSFFIKNIESLNGREAGSTPLYQSQRAATDFTATNAPSTNKAVMTFTDGEDTQGGYTSQQVIDNAVSKSVKLYNVGLGQAQILTLSNQAAQTGGAFMFAQDARQLISMFGNLGKMLDKTSLNYRTSWKITRNSGVFGTGTISPTVRITLPYGGELVVPFSLTY